MKMLLPDLMTSARPEALNAFEEGLRGPDAPQVRAQAVAQLQALEQRVRAAMSAGAAPQRYRELTALLDACLTAQQVLGPGPASAASSSMGASVRLS
ncbi:MAG: EscE/YscE/SsaE family type III secretion system needle protein co-chaperone [Comamonas sp.]